VHPATRHVRVGKSGVRLYCSAACLEAPSQHTEPEIAFVSERPRRRRQLALGGVAVLGGLIAIGTLYVREQEQGGGAMTAALVGQSPVAAAKLAAVTAGAQARTFGPPAPDEQAMAHEFLAGLDGDPWIHPLPGPYRRMPIRDSRVFGAPREGDRPGECRSGHCGVDIGGEMWGEPIYAVHSGVAERVNRDPSRSGGQYVRIAHRNGTIYTQYFHLAAIPRHLHDGSRIEAGEVIGLLGDTGVRDSVAHLHFTISVKPTEQSSEIYMDPEPLIALWPLKTPRIYGGADAAWDPGVPLGAHRGGKKKKKKKGKADAGSSDEDAPEEAAGEPAASATPPVAADPAGAGLPR
jgi:murein DD-endopeptidase MepM/ murein hydrolase activator NlpD